MALTVFASINSANAMHENRFFRDVASNLKAMFDAKQLDGVLIGHAATAIDKNFRPDALLITPHVSLIIEFKKSNGEIVLMPAEEHFLDGDWRARNANSNGAERIIVGGGQRNPADQVSKQIKRLDTIVSGVANRKVKIRGMVVLTGDSTFVNTIPAKFDGWFAVSNGFEYLNAIFDAVSTRDDTQLSSSEIETIRQSFDAKPFKDFYPVDYDSARALAEASEERSELQNEVSRLAEQSKRLQLKLSSLSESNSTEKSRLTKQLQDLTRELENVRASKKRIDRDFKKLLDDSETRVAQGKQQLKERKKATRYAMFAAAIALLVAGVWAVSAANQSISSQKEREQDINRAIECIDYVDAYLYVDSGRKCVSLHVGRVFGKDGYVWIEDSKDAIFTAWVPDDSVLGLDAAKKFIDQTIEVRGEIANYEGKPQIIIYDSNQIAVAGD